MPELKQPFREALAALQARAVMPTSAGSLAIADLPAFVLNRALFSARTTNLGYLLDMADILERTISPASADERAIDPATARLKLKQSLAARGYVPPDGREGSLKDLSSDRRLNLIINTQLQMAAGQGQHIRQQDPDLLDLFPCQELYRLEARKERRDWPARWSAAGGSVFGGRMIARKDDPVWRAISRFGNPFPPFDFNSGMWTRPISRGEAVKLGVIKKSEVVQPDPEAIGQPVEQSLPDDIDPELLDAALDALGGQVDLQGNKLVLRAF